MSKYGNLHRVSDFVWRTIPKRGGGDFSNLFVHKVVEHIRILDASQTNNRRVTLVIHAGDGIWFTYLGSRIFLSIPAQRHLRIIIARNGSKTAELLRSKIEKSKKFEDKHRPDYWQWLAGPEALKVIEEFVQELPNESPEDQISSGNHPRNFPGIVRQNALEYFEENGSICPGVGRSKHKVNIDYERIEFDHLIPYSRGGSTSSQNIQVLCAPCNNKKRATAL